MLLQPVSVFIVDDSSQVTEVLRELIAVPGSVEIAGTADAAARAVAEIVRLRPDFVILDLQLREGSGFDIIAGVRAHPEAANTVIVLFTNHMSAQLRNHALEIGADHFMDKSRDHARIIDLIGDEVRRRGG